MGFKDTLKNEWYVLLLALAPFIASAIIWSDVPDIVPTHFNAQGVADDFGPKSMLLLLIPGISFFVYLLLIAAPSIDPKKKIESTQKAIKAIRMITVLFMDVIYVVTVGIAMGYDIDMGKIIIVSVGALIFVMGNYMNSIKPNYFIGLRTPWTLENPEVWKKTHRLGSKLWMIGGILMMISPFFDLASTLGVSITVLMVIPLALIPLVYSYYIYNQLQKSTE